MIRTVTPDDAAAVVGLVRASQPLAVITPEAWLHRLRTVPESAALGSWVAEEDGAVIASAFAFRNFFGNPSTAIVGVTVAEARRRRGVGSLLWERVREHVDELESTSLMATFDENDAGVAFAAQRGFREVRAESHSVVDPATVNDVPPAGVAVVPVADADLREVYEVDMAATRDMPLTEQVPDLSYEEWAEHVLEHPLFTRQGSFVALVDGHVAAGVAPPRSAFAYLAKLERPDGSYRYSANYVTTPVWVTAQVLAALAKKAFPL